MLRSFKTLHVPYWFYKQKTDDYCCCFNSRKVDISNIMKYFEFWGQMHYFHPWKCYKGIYA